MLVQVRTNRLPDACCILGLPDSLVSRSPRSAALFLGVPSISCSETTLPIVMHECAAWEGEMEEDLG